MRREIKFRFWTGIEMRQPNLNTFLLSTSGSAWWQFGYDGIKPIPDWIPMQFTGLKDKNGVEIYDGDILAYGRTYNGTKIVHLGNCPLEVYYTENASFEVRKRGEAFGIPDFRGNMSWKFEVIGNIHQNPELL